MLNLKCVKFNLRIHKIAATADPFCHSVLSTTYTKNDFIRIFCCIDDICTCSLYTNLLPIVCHTKPYPKLENHSDYVYAWMCCDVVNHMEMGALHHFVIRKMEENLPKHLIRVINVSSSIFFPLSNNPCYKSVLLFVGMKLSLHVTYHWKSCNYISWFIFPQFLSHFFFHSSTPSDSSEMCRLMEVVSL